MPIPRTDKGRANRVGLEVPVHLQEGAALCIGVAKNIGPGGVFVATVRMLGVGSRVTVRSSCRATARHRGARRGSLVPPVHGARRSDPPAWGCASSTRRCAPSSSRTSSGARASLTRPDDRPVRVTTRGGSCRSRAASRACRAHRSSSHASGRWSTRSVDEGLARRLVDLTRQKQTLGCVVGRSTKYDARGAFGKEQWP